MQLNRLESEMLIDIYDADMLPEMPFEIKNYILTEKDPKNKILEFAFYLKKLKRLGLIKFEEKEVFTKIGSLITKYNNNVIRIYEDKVHIDSKGIKLVERYIYNNSEIQENLIDIAK